ncbi:helix-turn-helix transcriptional regulator [Halosquirtibacter laminarini]|uniref:Helix-turn-helix transcriptional regulator n=1 Tax=Halosquirtibacter laminarini TaxID=3374600 RepID=A0AC61NKS6_9BACT|nr:helix-turn-helix transcriptional regulator [Prolixibacteraceae bacterium]
MAINLFDFPNKDIQVCRISHDNGYDFSKIHRHDYYEIFLFEKGCGGSQIVDFEEYLVCDRSLFVIAPNQAHLLTRKQMEDGWIIQFSRSSFEKCLPLLPRSIGLKLKCCDHKVLEVAQFNSLIRRIEELVGLLEESDGMMSGKIGLYFSFLIYDFYDKFDSGEDIRMSTLTERFISFVEQDFRSERAIGYYASKLCVSAPTLTKQLKRDVSMTPLEVIHDVLLIEIKLLMKEKLSHKEISHLLHFDSQSSYSRFVMKMTGCKPSDLNKCL